MKREQNQPKNAQGKHQQTNKETCKRYGKSPVQIILKWRIQEGFISLPKSGDPQHIRENIRLDITLSDEDTEKIRAVDKDTSYFDTPEDAQERMFLSQNIDFDNQKYVY